MIDERISFRGELFFSGVLPVKNFGGSIKKEHKGGHLFDPIVIG